MDHGSIPLHGIRCGLTSGYRPFLRRTLLIELTPPELESALEARFSKKGLHKPKVTVEVTTFRPFYVLDELQKPGQYPYQAELNVLSAIAIAGGAMYRASTSEVLIQRAGTTDHGHARRFGARHESIF